MSDFLKSVFDAWDERIRSPILGSIALVYLAFYWKPLFVLFFSTDPASERMAEFNQGLEPWSWVAAIPFVETWVWPVVPLLLGLVLAFISPWIKFGGAWVAKRANERLAKLQEDEASAKTIRSFDNAVAELEAKKKLDVAEAARKQEILKIELATQEQLENADVSEDFKAKVIDMQIGSAEGASKLTEIEKRILVVGSNLNQKIFTYGKDSSLNVFQNDLKEVIPDINSARVKSEVDDALVKFENLKLAQNDGYGGYSLTSKGYNLSDELKQ